MAFTQKPGRSPFLKTGNGLPSALKQMTGDPLTEKQKASIDKTIATNKARVKIEEKATTDSIHAFRGAEKIGKSIKEAGVLGNQAANRARVSGGASDMRVERYKTVNAGGSYLEPKESKNVYVRKAPVEKDFERVSTKKSPMKQKVSKKTAYDIKEASNQKLKASARKNYAENAQAAMKNKKKK